MSALYWHKLAQHTSLPWSNNQYPWRTRWTENIMSMF